MSVTITLDDNLVAQLQLQAEARNLSVAELAPHILEEAVTNGGDAEWQACIQRQIELIRKQFAEGLRPNEAGELQQLQDMADQEGSQHERAPAAVAPALIPVYVT